MGITLLFVEGGIESLERTSARAFSSGDSDVEAGLAPAFLLGAVGVLNGLGHSCKW